MSKVFHFPLVLVFLLFFCVFVIRPKLKWHVIIYLLSVFLLLLIFFINGERVNGLLFFPVLSYFLYIILYSDMVNEEVKKVLDIFLKFIVIFLIFFSLFEILTKLNVVSFSYYSDFIKNYGDRRFDVLRTRVLWGSSLSSAAVGVFCAFYFSLVRKNIPFLLITFLYIMLTGSRTGMVLFILLLFVSLTKYWSFWRLTLSKKTCLSLFFMSPFFILILIWMLNSSIGRIVNRAFTIKADDSFTGRGNTTGVVLDRLLSDLPGSLFWGLRNASWTSDSAFTSIAAQSGILLLFLFLGYLFYLLLNTSFDAITKITFVIVATLGGWTIGDFFIPVVTFLYTITFLIYEKNTTHYYRSQ
ncbi:hypothetical protein P0F15_002556 [Vibrio metschnikovii]|nr:hypothetical protein [Vibrio metschnikovii]EKO3750503.1 hypothetical protein [Vibrio metschnikovii]EKO3756748.1 hypothetical protein [Vibrio metschnikovii]